MPGILSGKPFSEDFVSILSADGREERRISIVEAMLESPFAQFVDPERSSYGDLLHANGMQLLQGRIADRVPAFAAGRVLVSLGAQNAIAVVDLDSGRAVWAHARDFRYQHDPRVLASGNLLLLDNGGAQGPSRVLEIDPLTLERTWSFVGTPAQPFHTATCGTAQRLANGNTLITESDAGRAFEIERDGTIVWEYRNPHRAGPQRQLVAALLEVARVPGDLAWLEEPGS